MLEVSIVIPTKNRPDYLPEAVASVQRAVQFAKVDAEIIVIDDGEGATAEGALVVRNPRSGVSAARNHGVALASAPLIAFLDDDDVWLEQHLAVHLAAHSQGGIVASYSQGQLTDEALNRVDQPRPAAPLAHGWIQAFVLALNLQQVGTMVLRRDAYEAIGGFDESLTNTEDLDLVERLAEHGRFAGCEELTALWRQHDRPGPGSYAAWRGRAQQNGVVLRRSFGRASAAAMPFRWRLNRRIRNRGWTVHDGLNEATRCLRNRQRAEALRIIARAALVSPLHFARATPRVVRLLKGAYVRPGSEY